MIIVGIAGGTGSGKTTVAESILANIDSPETVLIDQDAYYKSNAELSFEERAAVNFDHPDAIDFPLLIKHLKKLKKGESIEKPLYDFTRHQRKKETEIIRPSRIVVVEGILIFAIPELRNLFDMKVFVDTDDDERLLRRVARDMEERERSFESIQKQYRSTVKPMHLEFVEPSKRYADVIIPRGGKNAVAIEMVSYRLKYLLRFS